MRLQERARGVEREGAKWGRRCFEAGKGSQGRGRFAGQREKAGARGTGPGQEKEGQGEKKKS